MLKDFFVLADSFKQESTHYLTVCLTCPCDDRGSRGLPNILHCSARVIRHDTRPETHSELGHCRHRLKPDHQLTARRVFQQLSCLVRSNQRWNPSSTFPTPPQAQGPIFLTSSCKTAHRDEQTNVQPHNKP